MARPDLLIVARGGGSIEDLWPFNDEALARAAAASDIALISAVGHETDTTLIDFVSDRRAPTPTAAAEIATPVLNELRALVLDYARRTYRCTQHQLETRRTRLVSAGRGLGRPADLLALASQRFDLAAGRLAAALDRNAALHERRLTRVGARLGPILLAQPVRIRAERLDALSTRLEAAARRAPDACARRARLPELGERLQAAAGRWLARAAERLAHLEQLRAAASPDRPLALGFARVHRGDGRIARAGAGAETRRRPDPGVRRPASRGRPRRRPAFSAGSPNPARRRVAARRSLLRAALFRDAAAPRQAFPSAGRSA